MDNEMFTAKQRYIEDCIDEFIQLSTNINIKGDLIDVDTFKPVIILDQ